MTRRFSVAAVFLATMSLFCWVLMFLAGTDVWQDVGRPDIWHLPGPPYADLRAFGVTFYALFVVLAAQIVVTVLNLRTGRQ